MEIASTETDDSETMHSGLQPVLTEESLMGELQRLISNVIRHAFAQSLKVRSDVSVGENSRNEELGQAKDKRHRLLEEVNAYEMEKRNLYSMSRRHL